MNMFSNMSVTDGHPVQCVMSPGEILEDETSVTEMPSVGLSVDRRVLSQIDEVFNESSISCHPCFICAEKNLYYSGFTRRGEGTDRQGYQPHPN